MTILMELNSVSAMGRSMCLNFVEPIYLALSFNCIVSLGIYWST